MELNITRLFREIAPMDYSASVAEIGRNAGQDTTDDQWADYQKQSEAGQVSGRIYKGADGEIYFYCGS